MKKIIPALVLAFVLIALPGMAFAVGDTTSDSFSDAKKCLSGRSTMTTAQRFAAGRISMLKSV